MRQPTNNDAVRPESTESVRYPPIVDSCGQLLWAGGTHVCIELLAVLDNVAAAGHAAAGKQHLEQRVTCAPKAPNPDVHDLRSCACAWNTKEKDRPWPTRVQLCAHDG